MRSSRRQNLLSIFRHDRMTGLWLALIVLLAPFVQPLSEANAAQKPFAAIICSTFGVAGEAAVPGLADDCATCIAGQHAPGMAVVPVDVEASPEQLPAASEFPAWAGALGTGSLWTLKPPGHAPPSCI